ncbi:MAG TPA: GntR family transcriptional regulator [Acidimicrobiia bacterium]|jgi:DNA-binding GntR family transcriptional regulator|nr:GntR family transcriptional regulator [Acidimicrobiia bacterium]
MTSEPPATDNNPPSIQRIRRPTTQETVVEALQQAILTGHFKPGEHLRQDAIAEQMGVSRVPVREALNVLRAEGQLDYSPHRGYRVSRLSQEEVEEINIIREMLEGEAIRRAVEKLDEDVIDDLVVLNRQLRKAHRNNDLTTFIRLNQEFHFLIFQQAGLPRLMQMIEGLWRVANGYRSGVFGNTANRERMLEEHDALIEALEAGDAERAVVIMENHRNSAADTLLSLTSPEDDT